MNACLRGQLEGNSDASFIDGFATQQAIAAVVEANEQFTWVPLRTEKIEAARGFEKRNKEVGL